METQNKGLMVDKVFENKVKSLDALKDVNSIHFEEVRKDFEQLSEKELQTKILIELKISNHLNNKIYKNVKFYFYLIVAAALLVGALMAIPIIAG